MLYKYVYDREVYRALDDFPCRLLDLGLSLTKVQVCKSFIRSTFSRVEDPCCMCLSLYSVTKKSNPKVLQEMLNPAFCAMWITTTAFKLTPPTSPFPLPSFQPLHYVCHLLQTKKWCDDLSSLPVMRMISCFPCKEQKGLLSPSFIFFLIMFSCYAISTREIKHPANSISGRLEILPALLRYRRLTLLCRKRDLVCDGLLTCANNVWNDCVVPICVRPHTRASWEIYIFVFQYSCTFIDIAV